MIAMKTIIGLVGEKGSGKETFGNFLMEVAKERVGRVRFSDILYETLGAWNLPQTRENLQHLAVVMDQGFGDGTLTNVIKKRVESLNADLVILDGVRWETDEMLVRSFPNNIMVYITADVKKRYQRLKKRDEKKGEAESFAKFLRSEKAKNELLIPKIGQRADLKIENNGTFEDLKNEVGKFFKKYLKYS